MWYNLRERKNSKEKIKWKSPNGFARTGRNFSVVVLVFGGIQSGAVKNGRGESECARKIHYGAFYPMNVHVKVDFLCECRL